MPLYEYLCKKCGHKTELIQRHADKPLRICPDCGGSVKKLISAPAIQFKGSGFYITDYGKGDIGGSSQKGEGGAEKGAGSSEKSESKSDAKTDTKSGSKSDGSSKAEASSKSEPSSSKSESSHSSSKADSSSKTSAKKAGKKD